ncbi:peptidase S8/S53 domain-containing protein [Linnemannia elongata]|nr:peptidase S8/S53 domain-containing protein [Linnemannia elongata]
MKIIVILSALTAVTLVSAGKFHLSTTGQGQSDTLPNAYIIEYHDNVSRSNAHANLKKHAIDYKVRNEYGIFNGAAISVKSSHGGAALAAVPGVKNVWPIHLYSHPKITPAKFNGTSTESMNVHHMTGVDAVHKKLKLTGKGVKVGIIDTGIDYKHPAFAAPGATEGCFARYGKNCRVKHGWDFVGDAYTSLNTPVPDADPMDCNGHGTHVAGIVGGNEMNIKTSPKPIIPWIGVAPEVTFGAYRIFGCEGRTGTDIILAAMEMAFNDGMDIINMSLYGGPAFKNNPMAILGEKLIAHGMNIAGCAGNDGAQGVSMIADTALGDSATSVASFDNAYGSHFTVSYAGGKYPYNPSVAWGNSRLIDLPATAMLFPLFDKAGVLQDGCDVAAYTGLDVKGKVVLLSGDLTRCGSVGRGNIAKGLGVAGILAVSTPFGMTLLSGVADLPMASLEARGGEAIIAAYKKNPKNVLGWSKTVSTVIVDGGGAPADMSSYGVDGDLRSKPDIGGPGGNIYSAYPRAKGSYALLSGTSMATPYYAGAQALYYQLTKTKPSGIDVRRVFKNTATISKNWGSKTYASVAKQGAGLINVWNALTTSALVSPDHIDLLDSVNLRKIQQITIKNVGRKTETYTLSHSPADALNSYTKGNVFPHPRPVIEADYALVSFSANKVKIPAGKSVKITVTFAEPKVGNAAQFPLYSGFVVATPATEGSPSVHVPYIGLKGDVSKMPIMDTDLGFPSLAVTQANGTVINVPTSNFVFNFKTAAPTIIVRYGSHSPDGTIRVIDATTKKFLGYVFTAWWGAAFGPTGRNANLDANGKYDARQYAWRGEVWAAVNATAPVQLGPGSYNIVVANQKKLTKGAYPADYEVFDLGTVEVSV